MILPLTALLFEPQRSCSQGLRLRLRPVSLDSCLDALAIVAHVNPINFSLVTQVVTQEVDDGARTSPDPS
jgi:hypothetical protein